MKTFIINSVLTILSIFSVYYLWLDSKQDTRREEHYLTEIEKCNKIINNNKLLRLINSETSDWQEEWKIYNIELLTDEFGPV